MNKTALTHKEEIQRKILRKKPEIIYRRNIQRLFECLNYMDNEVIKNAVVLLPEPTYDFLSDFDMKDKIIKLWEERVKNVFYHSEEQMYDWFKDCLKTPNIQEIYQIAFGHNSEEKAVLLIHVAFDEITIYFQHKEVISRVFEYFGTRDFMKERDGEYPSIFNKMKEVIDRFKDLDILLNINGFSIECNNINQNQNTDISEEEYIDDFDRMLSIEFNKTKQARDKIENNGRNQLTAELQEHFCMNNFDQEQNYIFYLYCQKFFFEYYPYKEIIMNCWKKIPIHICRAGYLISNRDIELCIIDDWTVATVWLYDGNKIIHHASILKDMGVFSEQLKNNLVDEYNYLKKMKKDNEANEKYNKLARFMSRFTNAMCLPDVL